MLILILIDIQYLQNLIFSFEKGLNDQNHSSSDSHHLIKKIALRKIFHLHPLGEFPHPLTLFWKPWVENHSEISPNLWQFDDVQSSWKLMISFVVSAKNEYEFIFGCSPWWHWFCSNRVLKVQFLKVLAFFQNYSIVI